MSIENMSLQIFLLTLCFLLSSPLTGEDLAVPCTECYRDEGEINISKSN